MYSESFVAADLAQGFFTALAKGAQELGEDGTQTDEVYEILADTLGQDIEVLKASPMYTYLPDLAPQPEQLEAMQAVWLEAEQISYAQPDDIVDYVYASFAEGAVGCGPHRSDLSRRSRPGRPAPWSSGRAADTLSARARRRWQARNRGR